MKTILLTKFKNLFEQEKKNLIYSQGIINEEFQVQADDMLDEVDLSSAELEQSMRMRLRNREALYLKKIEESLRRIQDGTFGICETCEEDIELKRLEARPTTTHCMDCKERQERIERIHIDGQKHKSLGARMRLA